jgi:hypothetical protein
MFGGNLANMRFKQCKVQYFNAKASPFPKSTKTSAYGWEKGSTKVITG